MINYKLIKQYLIEIIEIDPIISNESITKIIDRLPHFELTQSHVKYLYSFLIDYINIEKTKVHQKANTRKKIVLIIKLLDELNLFETLPEYWTAYLDARLKTFSYYIRKKNDSEAAILFKDLKALIKKVSERDTEFHKRIESDLKYYTKSINDRLKNLEKQNNYNEAQFLNSIYFLHPDYDYSSKLEEKEKKYLRMPFFEIVLDIIIPGVLTIILVAINAILNFDQDKNLIQYFLKAQFTLFELSCGFLIIYIIFWLFKILEYSQLSIRLTILAKTLIFIMIFGLLEFYVTNKYKTHYKRYFVTEEKKKTIQDENKTRILIIKFKPLEEHSFFAREYSELNTTQLFYKRILSLNQTCNGLPDPLCLIDLYPYPLKLESPNDFNELLNNKKYDAIISGEFFERSTDIMLFTSLFITKFISNSNVTPDKLFKNRNQLLNISENKIQFDNYVTSLDSFLCYSAPPKEYYTNVCRLSNIKKRYILESVIPFDLDYNIENIYSTSLNFVNTVELTPLVCLNYIKVVKYLSKLLEAPKSIPKYFTYCGEEISQESSQSTFNLGIAQQKSLLDEIDELHIKKILKCIKNIRKWEEIEVDQVQKIKMLELNLYLNQIKLYCLTRLIENETDYIKKYNFWETKINTINDAIRELGKIHNISQSDIDSYVTCNSFINFYYLNNRIRILKRDEDATFFRTIQKPIYTEFKYKILPQVKHLKELNNNDPLKKELFSEIELSITNTKY